MNYEIAEKFRSGQLKKPVAKLIGADGNVFNLLGICSRALRRMPNAYNELWERVQKAKSYDEALQIMMEYVEVE